MPNGLDNPPIMCDIVGMDKRKLQKIIDVNADAAEMGCATSQSLIVLAQSQFSACNSNKIRLDL